MLFTESLQKQWGNEIGWFILSWISDIICIVFHIPCFSCCSGRCIAITYIFNLLDSDEKLQLDKFWVTCCFNLTPGVKESSHCSKGKDNRTYSHWKAGAGAHPPVSLPGYTPLCLSDAEQTTSHFRWVMPHYSQMQQTLVSSIFWIMVPWSLCLLLYVLFGGHLGYSIECRLKLPVSVCADYVSGGELFTHLYQRDHFPEEAVRIYIGEIILALEHLHKVGVASSSLYISHCVT